MWKVEGKSSALLHLSLQPGEAAGRRESSVVQKVSAVYGQVQDSVYMKKEGASGDVNREKAMALVR